MGTAVPSAVSGPSGADSDGFGAGDGAGRGIPGSGPGGGASSGVGIRVHKGGSDDGAGVPGPGSGESGETPASGVGRGTVPDPAGGKVRGVEVGSPLDAVTVSPPAGVELGSADSLGSFLARSGGMARASPGLGGLWGFAGVPVVVVAAAGDGPRGQSLLPPPPPEGEEYADGDRGRLTEGPLAAGRGTFQNGSWQ